jgi:putative DNA primase/helicase
MVSHALAHAARGWHVFPAYSPIGGRCDCGTDCGTNAGKHPRVGWKAGATTNPAQIRRWWSSWPTANIGIACGPSGLFVLDVDDKDGGVQSLEHLLKRCSLERFDSVTVKTPGGRHIYFRRPPGLEYTISKGSDRNPIFGRGIDVRAVGGYVVAPGSRHASGGVYRFGEGYADVTIAPATLPESLQSILACGPLRCPTQNTVNVIRQQATLTVTGAVPVAVTVANSVTGHGLPEQAELEADEAQEWSDPRPLLRDVARIAIEPPEADGGSRLSPWAVAWELTEAFREYEKNGRRGSKAHRADLVAVARDVIRAKGDGPDGHAIFLRAVQHKRWVSPDLANPSSTGDTRSPFDENRCASAWYYAVERPFDDMPSRRFYEALKDTGLRGAVRVYAGLFLEALRLGVRPSSFGKDSRTLAKLLGAPRTTVRRWIAQAEQCGLIEIIDRGRQRAENDHGAPAVYEIVTAAIEFQRETAATVELLERASPQAMQRPPAILPESHRPLAEIA